MKSIKVMQMRKDLTLELITRGMSPLYNTSIMEKCADFLVKEGNKFYGITRDMYYSSMEITEDIGKFAKN